MTTSFQARPNGWTDLFAVSTKPHEFKLYAIGEETYEQTLDGISGEVHQVLTRISEEAATTNVPIIVRLWKDDQVITDISGDISHQSYSLESLKSEVAEKTKEVINSTSAYIDTPDSVGFEDDLERYKVMKRVNDTAIEKHKQQMNSHIISLSTNLAIFAGALGILYMATKK